MLMWIWIAVVVLAVLILAAAAAPLLGRLGGLRRSLRSLQLRQADAARLQVAVAELAETVREVQSRAEVVQEHVAELTPGRK